MQAQAQRGGEAKGEHGELRVDSARDGASRSPSLQSSSCRRRQPSGDQRSLPLGADDPLLMPRSRRLARCLCEQISHLSSMVELKPGDLIFMGTPHGWGPLLPGDEVEGGLDGAEGLALNVKFKMTKKK